MNDLMMNLIAADLGHCALYPAELRDALVDDFCHAVAREELRNTLDDPEQFFMDYCADHPAFNTLVTLRTLEQDVRRKEAAYA